MMSGLDVEVVRFMVVGVIAAGVEFVGFNGFVRYFGCGARVRANLVAVTFAMTLSFVLNRNWSFADINSGSWPVVEFVVVTLIAAYGLQSFVIWLLSLDSRGSHSSFNVGGLVYVSWIGLPRREVRRLAYGLAGCGGGVSAGRVDFVERVIWSRVRRWAWLWFGIFHGTGGMFLYRLMGGTTKDTKDTK